MRALRAPEKGGGVSPPQQPTVLQPITHSLAVPSPTHLPLRIVPVKPPFLFGLAVALVVAATPLAHASTSRTTPLPNGYVVSGKALSARRGRG